MKVTKKLLEKHNACADQIEILEKEWPDGVVLSEDVLYRALEIGLNIRWFVTHVFPPTVSDSYNKVIEHAMHVHNIHGDHMEKVIQSSPMTTKGFMKINSKGEAPKSPQRVLDDINVAAFMEALRSANME